ncbi:unnamed protein product [Cuscuta campestris]|uniref:Uncharacterized protein n=1 Tax=Cuscuta campestris TaxID=132261 RepID=A0A484KW62_9ASTE|nr:unnamed protein product [Cuscuta campestris]
MLRVERVDEGHLRFPSISSNLLDQDVTQVSQMASLTEQGLNVGPEQIKEAEEEEKKIQQLFQPAFEAYFETIFRAVERQVQEALARTSLLDKLKMGLFQNMKRLLVPSKKELDHSSKVGSFLDMTPEENEDLVERLTSNAKYWYEDRAPQQKAGMYEVDSLTASMESLIKQIIQDQFSASSRSNKPYESVAQADNYCQGSSSSHSNELVLSCESCTGAHLTAQCPYYESPIKEKPREANLAQQAKDPTTEMKKMLEEKDKKNEERIQRLEESIRQLMEQMTIRPPGTLPAKTENNPREHLKAVTLRSGRETKGIGQSSEPTLKDSVAEPANEPTEKRKEEEKNPEEKKDEEPFQSQHPNGDLPPKKVTIPFPSRVKKSKDEKAFKKFLDIMGQVEVIIRTS